MLHLALSPALAAAFPSPDTKGFRREIAPLLSQYCADCHGAEDPEGKFDIAAVTPTFDGESLETWRLIDEQIRFGDMPPEEAEQMPADDKASVLKWIRGELLKTQLPGVVTDEKLLLPQFGNYVDHRMLFDRRLSRVYPAPPRLWRLRPDIYNTIVPRLGEKIDGLANALNATDGSEFKDFSAIYFLDEASTQQLFSNAKLVVARLVGPNAKDRVFRELVAESGPPTGETVEAAIETGFRKALGRGPTEDERQRFAGLYERSKEIGGYQSAARALLMAIILQPEFMFRQELGEETPDEHGRIRLTQREIAYALAYTLTDRPQDAFLRAAADGKLGTREEVHAIVSEQLADDSFKYDKNPRVLEFFRQYFHYPFAAEVFKDRPEGGVHESGWLIADLETTLKEILKRDENVLAELLTTRDYYLRVQPGRKQTEGQYVGRDDKSRLYQTAFNLPLDWKFELERQPLRFPEDERAGVLTHPAWLAAWSGNFENHPVQRGKWIRTHLLGGSVPDVPIGVDARVPEKEHTTFRDRLKLATSAAECWRCHRKMDPLGVAFERYDHYGRLQRFDAGQPVDASGEISRTEFPELHGKVGGPTEMMDRLARSERVEQAFVRHAFRYFLGRNETLGDANTLQDAHRAYRESGGSFNALVASLLASDSFLFRQPQPSSDAIARIAEEILKE